MTDLKLNLGAGSFPIEGFKSIDRKTGQEIYPLDYPDNSAERIYCSHALEHFSHRDTQEVLNDWVRVLAPGGELLLAVPDFKWIAKNYLEGIPDNYQGYVMGGHVDEDDIHGAIFDESGLRQLMENAGLANIERWESRSDIQDCSSLPVSLNLKGTKPSTDKPPRTPQKPADGPYSWLHSRAKNVYSQFGEDGVLEAIFERIGTTSKWCCEVGAGDGMQFSNTRRLIEQGWGAVLGERDYVKYRRMMQAFIEISQNSEPRIYCPIIHLCEVSAEKPRYGRNPARIQLADLLSRKNPDAVGDLKEDYDLIIIDVDGQDYHLWNSLLHYRPRVVVIEFDPSVDPDFIPAIGGEGQAGKEAILRLGYGKGYRPIVQTGNNLIFVLAELAPMLEGEIGKGYDRAYLKAFERLGVVPEKQEAEPALKDNGDGTVTLDREVVGRDIKAVMSVPRLCFSANMQSALAAFLPLGVTFNSYSGVFWEQSLTEAMLPHTEDGTKYILTLDYDTVFNAEDVAALYVLMEQNPHVDALCALQMKREADTALFTMPYEDGKPVDRLDARAMDEPLLAVRSGHFGLTMIRVETLKRLPHPWFHGQPDVNGRWDTPEKMDADISFWHAWMEHGFSLYQANRVVIGHLQLVVTWPGRELKPVFQMMTDYKDQGKPKDSR